MPVIETKKLSKRYANGVEGIIDLDISVEEGQIFGFLGPNGSGKTTTVRLLNGTLSASGGTAYIFGKPCEGEVVRKRTATLAEEALMYEHLSVTDNLRFFAALYDIDRREADQRIAALVRRMGLEGREHDALAIFSTGMKKRVYLARTLLHRPSVIFLDEPSSGLDPEASLKVTNLIKQLASEEGTTIFLCTHNLTLAERICDSIGLLENGRLLASGAAQKLKQSISDKQELVIRTLSGTQSRSFSGEKEINGILRSVMDAGESIVEVEIKDLSEVGVNKMVVIPMIIVLLVLCVVVPSVILFIALSADLDMINGIQFIEKIIPYYPVPEGMENLTLRILYIFLNFTFIPFFMIVPLMVSSIIASNGIVGEKERKTLETLLYTPVTNREFLIGKLSAALMPAVALSWVSFLMFFGISNIISYALAGVMIISSPMWIPSMLLLAPSVSLLGLGITLMVSLKAKTFMEAQQMSGVVVLPFIILIIVQITGILVFNLLFIFLFGLLLIGTGFLIVLRLAPRFTRETIITRAGSKNINKNVN